MILNRLLSKKNISSKIAVSSTYFIFNPLKRSFLNKTTLINVQKLQNKKSVALYPAHPRNAEMFFVFHIFYYL